jgi:hypothetical protein
LVGEGQVAGDGQVTDSGTPVRSRRDASRIERRIGVPRLQRERLRRGPERGMAGNDVASLNPANHRKQARYLGRTSTTLESSLTAVTRPIWRALRTAT